MGIFYFYIALVDDDAQQYAYNLTATDLDRLLADERLSLRLVLLNACEGARGSLQEQFSSTAAKLVYKGIPAILAMQEGITDQAAIQLAKTFYESLADAMPVDMALGEAHKAISLAEPEMAESRIPILYMSSPDGLLFTMTDQKQPAQQPPEKESARFFIPILTLQSSQPILTLQSRQPIPTPQSHTPNPSPLPQLQAS